ncbi:MAG: hypothetical protein AAF571_12280 [Verrucomicrobiota bacterium]
MIFKDTVFVLGAGASAHYGFPTGKTLVKNITDLCSYDFHSNGRKKQMLIDQMGYRQEQLYQFGDRLESSNVISIDRFLAQQSESDRHLGKILIALELLPIEELPIYSEDLDMPDLYKTLLNYLMPQGALSGIKNNRVTIVSFNYDRSLEHYLASSLSALYGASLAECYDYFTPWDGVDFKYPEIRHVHGSFGQLDGDSKLGGLMKYGSTDFSNGYPASIIEKAAQNIRIVSEQSVGTNLEIIRNRINNADQICFLGFSFDPENLHAIGLSHFGLAVSQIDRNLNNNVLSHLCASRMGLEDGEVKGIEADIMMPIRWADKVANCEVAIREVFLRNQAMFE